MTCDCPECPICHRCHDFGCEQYVPITRAACRGWLGYTQPVLPL